MRKIRKIVNIALIFILISVLVCADIGYASNLRVPIIDKRRIGATFRWSTKEKGITNVRSAIQSNKPAIIKQYDNLGLLSESEKDALRNNIYNITSGHFRVWGLGRAMNPKSASYFEASYIVALQKVFPDLELNPLGFKLEWSTKERGIASIRYILSREQPRIIEQYDRFASLSEPEKEILRNNIYKITSGHFKVWGLAGAINFKLAPYFEASYIVALQEVFPDLELNPLGFQLDWSTKEQGIASIRYILSREQPRIIEQYDRFDSLSESEKEIVRNNIYKITFGHFSVWGLNAAINPKPKSPSYFKGSYIVALQEVFPGLELNPLGFRLDWSTKERGIASIRYILSREQPRIIEQYDDLDSLNESEKDALRNSIYKITQGRFKVWGLAGAMNPKLAPYFEGSYITALAIVFSDSRLGFSEEELREFRKDTTVRRYGWISKELGMRNVRRAIGLNRPDIIEQYDDLDSLSESEKEILRNNIYEITQGYFNVWGLAGAMDPRPAPYFKGSHIIALQEVFPDLELKQGTFIDTKEKLLDLKGLDRTSDTDL